MAYREKLSAARAAPALAGAAAAGPQPPRPITQDAAARSLAATRFLGAISDAATHLGPSLEGIELKNDSDIVAAVLAAYTVGSRLRTPREMLFTDKELRKGAQDSELVTDYLKAALGDKFEVYQRIKAAMPPEHVHGFLARVRNATLAAEHHDLDSLRAYATGLRAPPVAVLRVRASEKLAAPALKDESRKVINALDGSEFLPRHVSEHPLVSLTVDLNEPELPEDARALLQDYTLSMVDAGFRPLLGGMLDNLESVLEAVELKRVVFVSLRESVPGAILLASAQRHPGVFSGQIIAPEPYWDEILTLLSAQLASTGATMAVVGGTAQARDYNARHGRYSDPIIAELCNLEQCPTAHVFAGAGGGAVGMPIALFAASWVRAFEQPGLDDATQALRWLIESHGPSAPPKAVKNPMVVQMSEGAIQIQGTKTARPGGAILAVFHDGEVRLYVAGCGRTNIKGAVRTGAVTLLSMSTPAMSMCSLLARLLLIEEVTTTLTGAVVPGKAPRPPQGFFDEATQPYTTVTKVSFIPAKAHVPDAPEAAVPDIATVTSPLTPDGQDLTEEFKAVLEAVKATAMLAEARPIGVPLPHSLPSDIAADPVLRKVIAVLRHSPQEPLAFAPATPYNVVLSGMFADASRPHISADVEEALTGRSLAMWRWFGAPGCARAGSGMGAPGNVQVISISSRNGQTVAVGVTVQTRPIRGGADGAAFVLALAVHEVNLQGRAIAYTSGNRLIIIESDTFESMLKAAQANAKGAKKDGSEEAEDELIAKIPIKDLLAAALAPGKEGGQAAATLMRAAAEAMAGKPMAAARGPQSRGAALLGAIKGMGGHDMAQLNAEIRRLEEEGKTRGDAGEAGQDADGDDDASRAAALAAMMVL